MLWESACRASSHELLTRDKDGRDHLSYSKFTRLTRSHVTAFYAFADIVLVIFGCILAWSKGLSLGKMAGIGFLGILGLLSVQSLIFFERSVQC